MSLFDGVKDAKGDIALGRKSGEICPAGESDNGSNASRCGDYEGRRFPTSEQALPCSGAGSRQRGGEYGWIKFCV